MNNREPSYIKIGTVRGIPMLIHWSFPIGGLLVALLFQAERWEILYVCSAYAALIVFHEIGHALAARIFGMRVFAIKLFGLGGICLSEVPPTRQTALIYTSAGLILQVILLAVVGTYVHYYGWPKNVAGSSIVFVFSAVNMLLILMNLIPYKVRCKNYGTDGYVMWKLIVQLFRRRPYGYPNTSAEIKEELTEN